ncbi:MAG TPA: hypothetical protein VFK44_13080, partial [Bacillales bacterium]|nr:hypothetical protein [Bacillales bacterium]
YIIRHGELIVFTPEAADNDNTLSRITAVSYDHYKAEMYRWKDRISEQTKHLRFKRDPERYLKAIEEKWITE